MMSSSSTVLVSNLKPSTTMKCISLYFANKRRNAGGPIASMVKLDDSTALIHFKEHKDAESVVNRGHHVLDDSQLKLTLVREPETSVASERQRVKESTLKRAATHALVTTTSQSIVVETETMKKGSNRQTWEKSSAHDGDSQATTSSTSSSRQHIKKRGQAQASRCSSSVKRSRLENTAETEVQPGKKMVRLGAVLVDQITGDSDKLRSLALCLRQSVNGKFSWKRPDQIVVTTSQPKPPADWEQQVDEALSRFVQSLNSTP